MDYLAVICLIKSAESSWGALTTVSGAWVAFRREAVLACGGWDEGVATEDIDLSWKLQKNGWRLDYEPTWVASVEMAPTWKAVWRQRKRWSSGMGRTLRDHFANGFDAGASHMPIAFLNLFTHVWIFSFVFLGLARIGDVLWHMLGGGQGDWESGPTAIYWLTCLGVFITQLVIALIIDGASWRRLPIWLALGVFYPFYFWFILFPAFLAGFPKGVLRRDSGRWRRTARLEEVRDTP